ncbi:MAG: PqqD family protein [Bacteroidaceae bacterium]|nr:PqqD family protein [Bacteroidaceae bacterium]MBP9637945.1 PqqD family protein [Bacteroidaceae bacterium]
MKQKQGFNLRHVGSEHIIVAEGLENIDFSKIISLNDSAAFLWTKVKDKEFTIKDLAELLIEEYDIDDATASTDAEVLAESWVKADIVEV